MIRTASSWDRCLCFWWKSSTSYGWLLAIRQLSGPSVYLLSSGIGCSFLQVEKRFGCIQVPSRAPAYGPLTGDLGPNLLSFEGDLAALVKGPPSGT
jgi:hypothetical protein